MMDRPARPTESVIGAQVDELAHVMGWDVERYEQRRATMITEGLPDRRYVHRGKAARLWVELKRPGGKLTEHQHAWLLAELDAGALATVIDDVQQFAHLARLLSRGGSSLMHAEALAYCRQLVDLCWRRGPRDTRASQPRRRGRGGRGRLAADRHAP
jgi:hypothetical protein